MLGIVTLVVIRRGLAAKLAWIERGDGIVNQRDGYGGYIMPASSCSMISLTEKGGSFRLNLDSSL